MSHTDKDEPWYMRARWFVPKHHLCEFDHGRRSRPYELRECNLPTEPDRTRDQMWRPHDGCFWFPEWDWHGYYGPPNREGRHLQWFGPDRARVRDSLKSAAKEYRAAGDVTTVPPTEHHRHSPINGWWH
jgi:hypothetical protein